MTNTMKSAGWCFAWQRLLWKNFKGLNNFNEQSGTSSYTLCCSREKRFRKGMFSNVFTCGMWLPCVRRISDEGGFELKLLWLQITNSWGIPTRNDTQLCIVIFKCMQEQLNPAWNSFACLWAPTAYPWPSYGWKMIERRCTKVIWVVGFRQKVKRWLHSLITCGKVLFNYSAAASYSIQNLQLQCRYKIWL